MADGTRFAQLSETVAANKQESSGNSETQPIELLNNLVEQVSTLASNFAFFSQKNSQSTKTPEGPNGEGRGEKNKDNSGGENKNGREEKGKEKEGENSGEHSYVEKEGGVHTRPLKLDFPRFDGAEPNNWILKAQ
jgi:hypothetical protein